MRTFLITLLFLIFSTLTFSQNNTNDSGEIIVAQSNGVIAKISYLKTQLPSATSTSYQMKSVYRVIYSIENTNDFNVTKAMGTISSFQIRTFYLQNRQVTPVDITVQEPPISQNITRKTTRVVVYHYTSDFPIMLRTVPINFNYTAL